MKTITFEHYGKKYTMTEEEIEAAYRYQLHQHRLKDALRQLGVLVFGDADWDSFDTPDALKDTEGLSEMLKNYDIDFQEESNYFFEKYGVTFEDASTPETIEEYVRRFENRFDCSEDENSLWEATIEAVLMDMKEAV